MKNKIKFLVVIVIIAVIGFTLAGCGEDDGSGNGIWLWSSQKMYTVTNGVAGTVSYSIDVEWIQYKNDKNFQQRYSYIVPYNTQTVTDTYTMSQVGSYQYTYNGSRNGNTGQSTTHLLYNITTSIDYVNPSLTDTSTTSSQDITTTGTTTYDDGSGLILSTTSQQTGTNNGNPVNTSSTTNYSVELISTSGGTKIFKYTNLAGTGAYSEYKITNGVTMEVKNYNADNVLQSTTVYSFPNNSTIRERLPSLTISGNQTCDLLSSSSSEMVIRFKNYTTENVLQSQYDTTYRKR